MKFWFTFSRKEEEVHQEYNEVVVFWTPRLESSSLRKFHVSHRNKSISHTLTFIYCWQT